ncbi:hypothetical protein ACFX2J_035360 [Malus domestica]
MVSVSSQASVHVHHLIIEPVVLPSPSGHFHSVGSAFGRHNTTGFDVIDEGSGFNSISESATRSFEQRDNSANVGSSNNSLSSLEQDSGTLSSSQAFHSSAPTPLLQQYTEPLLHVHHAA